MYELFRKGVVSLKSIYPDETLDDLKIDGLKIIQKKQGFRFSIDAILLSHFVKLKKGDKVLDLGTGTAVIPLLLSTKKVADYIVGLEIQENLVEMAKRTIQFNAKEKQIDIRLGDILNLHNLFGHGEFDLIVSNPPYFPSDKGKLSLDEAKSISRQEVRCDINTIILQVGKLLNYHGRFAVIYPSSRFSELIEELKKVNIKPIRCRFVHSYVDKKSKLVLLEARKGSKSQLEVMAPLIIYDKPGVYSQEVKNWYGGSL